MDLSANIDTFLTINDDLDSNAVFNTYCGVNIGNNDTLQTDSDSLNFDNDVSLFDDAD